VLFAWRSFECYPIVAKVAGATPVQVPLTAEFEHDFDAMAAAVTERTRLIFVCNPNNPTGASIPPAKIEAFLAAVPSDVVVVLDEAYFEFNRDENGQPMPPEGGGISFVKSHPNVAVTRTFSKAFGLAGARLGYIIARPELQEQLSKVRVPFSVNSLAQAAALASLDAADELLARTGGVIAERDRVRAALQAVGYQIPPSWANYLYFPLGERSGEFAAAAAEAGLLLRAYGADGVRASVGDPDENDAFIAWAVSPAARELAGLGAEATIG
jgi:histidinol-phosphate aminotransferase